MFHRSEFPLSPLYSDDNNLSNLRDELPSYSAPGTSRSHSNTLRERPLHEFKLENSNKHPWASVRFQSWAPTAKSLPVFLEDHDISGQVDLDLQQPENIKSVEVLIEGIVSGGHDDMTFFSKSETLWTSSFGHPHTVNEQSRMKYTGKLKGKFSWPFSISIPHEAAFSEKVAKKLHLKPVEILPPSLQGSGWNSAISYRLVVNIRKGGVFSSNSSIITFVGYTPTRRPDMPSAARRRAYREKTLIPGPSLDPNGWQVLRDIKMSGVLFKQRNVTLSYKLSLAIPLTYTRGTVIPCHLTVRSSDKQALDLLASPSAPRVTLRRKLTAHVVLAPRERVDLSVLQKGESEPLSKAIWAPSESNEDERTLVGELSVPLGCTPSFSFGEFNMEYFIDVYSPTSAGFQPESEKVFVSTPVQVVSAHAEGSPRPRAYITPAHDASQRVAQSDALMEQMSSLTLGRAGSPNSGSSGPGSTSRPGTSSGIGGLSPPVFGGMSRTANDPLRVASPSSPSGSRRLNRRFSAI